MISFSHWHLSSVLFYITCIFPVIWAYPKCESTFPSKSQPECPSVCPVLFRFQHTNAEKDLFEAKQVFMFSVFDKHLLTDMGKTTVRKYVHTTDAQSVWMDFQDHMKSSSKGASEKRRLTQYVTNTALDDNYKVQQSSLYFISMSSSDNWKKYLTQLNIFLHKSNYSCCKM